MLELRIEYNCTDCEHGYVKELVDRLMLSEFPGSNVANTESTVDVIANTFMGTRATRLAGMPNPESQVRVRSVIRDAIAQRRQIPVLVGSGPKKNNSGHIDLAELSAMRTLSCLQAAVLPYHAPGFSFRIRLEDATGVFLEGSEAMPFMRTYCQDFMRLCSILNARVSPGQTILPPLVPYLESTSAPSMEEFLELSEKMVSAFYVAITTGNDSEAAKLGWVSGVSDGWRTFLRDRYSKIYPMKSETYWATMAARYLSATLARTLLKMRGDDPNWCIDGRHLELNFAPPSPGAPTISSRVYYRTMSTKHTKLHVPFWRGKGFFKLVNGELKMGLVPGTAKGNSYIPGSIILDDGIGDPLKIQADLLEDTYQ